jgi:anti-anti-sigma factor
VTITENREGAAVVVNLAGQLDGFSTPDLERHFLKLVEAGEKSMVVDLTELEYVSSVGIGSLFLVHKRLKEAGGHICFCNAREVVREIFEVSRMLEFFDFKANRAEAIASFA